MQGKTIQSLVSLYLTDSIQMKYSSLEICLEKGENKLWYSENGRPLERSRCILGTDTVYSEQFYPYFGKGW